MFQPQTMAMHIYTQSSLLQGQFFGHQRSGIHLLLFKILFIFRERRREGEREGEKHQYVVASHTPPTGDLACNPGMSPDWELNQ